MLNPRHTHLGVLIVVLLVAGLSIFAYRAMYLHVPLTPTKETDSWLVEANLKFDAGPKAIKAELKIPQHPPHYAMLDETFLSRNYGINFLSAEGQRTVVWSVRRASGIQSLYYRAIYYPDRDGHLPGLKKPKQLVKPEFTEAQKTAVDSIIKAVREKSADIETFAAETIKILNDPNDSNAATILNRDSSVEAVTHQTVKLLSQANIHAKFIRGVYLSSQKNAKLHPWLAVYNGKQWLYFNPGNGQAELPKNFLIWQYGDGNTAEVSGAGKPTLTITVVKSPVSALELAQKRNEGSELIKFSLFGLPLKTQQVYQILLTVPIGAFVILLLRNYVGLVTFGTFMPVLIAMAFRETQLLSGIFLFSLIVSIGLLVRFYLEQLRLLLIPRLTAILITVILFMMLISIFSQQLGFVSGITIALFPMVILTMVIERMCILWEERGPKEAMMSGVGSLVAASLAYLTMQNAVSEYIFFAFPELLLVLLGLTLLFGQYRGYRLTELKRFKAFVKDAK